MNHTSTIIVYDSGRRCYCGNWASCSVPVIVQPAAAAATAPSPPRPPATGAGTAAAAAAAALPPAGDGDRPKAQTSIKTSRLWGTHLCP